MTGWTRTAARGRIASTRRGCQTTLHGARAKRASQARRDGGPAARRRTNPTAPLTSGLLANSQYGLSLSGGFPGAGFGAAGAGLGLAAGAGAGFSAGGAGDASAGGGVGAGFSAGAAGFSAGGAG